MLTRDKIVKSMKNSISTNKIIFPNKLKTLQCENSDLTIEVSLDSIYSECSKIYLTEKIDRIYIGKKSWGKCTNFARFLNVFEYSSFRVKCFAMADVENHFCLVTERKIPTDVSEIKRLLI